MGWKCGCSGRPNVSHFPSNIFLFKWNIRFLVCVCMPELKSEALHTISRGLREVKRAREKEKKVQTECVYVGQSGFSFAPSMCKHKTLAESKQYLMVIAEYQPNRQQNRLCANEIDVGRHQTSRKMQSKRRKDEQNKTKKKSRWKGRERRRHTHSDTQKEKWLCRIIYSPLNVIYLIARHSYQMD